MSHGDDLGTTDSGLAPNIAAILCYFPFRLGLMISFFFVASESSSRWCDRYDARLPGSSGARMALSPGLFM